MTKVGLLLIALSCVQLSQCLEWQNSILKLENGVITKTELNQKKAEQTTTTPKEDGKKIETGQRNYFRLPENLVHEEHLPVFYHQEPVVPIVHVEPVYNHVQRPPIIEEHHVPIHHEEHHVPVHHEEHHVPVHHEEHHVPIHHEEHYDHHHDHHVIAEPFPIHAPVVDTHGQVIVENTVGGIPFDCRFLPTGHWRDPNFCDVFHACVHGYHRKTYTCPIVGERTYYDEITRRCEFVHLNPHACGGAYHHEHHEHHGHHGDH